jgi:hypothetical protein
VFPRLLLISVLATSCTQSASMSCTTPDCPSSGTDTTKVVIISSVGVLAAIALIKVVHDVWQLGTVVSAMQHGSNT